MIQLCLKAESTGKLAVVTQANSPRKTAKDKIQELTDLDVHCKLKFQAGKAKRIDTIKLFSEVCDLISCTTLAISCLYWTFLCRTFHTKSHLNWGVDYMHVKLSGKQVFEKMWFVLEKYLKRTVSGLYEPCLINITPHKWRENTCTLYLKLCWGLIKEKTLQFCERNNLFFSTELCHCTSSCGCKIWQPQHCDPACREGFKSGHTQQGQLNYDAYLRKLIFGPVLILLEECSINN